jgi:putative membrane protein
VIEQLIKALHIVAVISWMAGMLYLPRLFVYHAGQPTGSEAARLFEVMEYRLYRYIMLPAMLVTWMTGLYLGIVVFEMRGGWLYGKLAMVLAMSAHHGMQGKWRRDLANGANTRSQRFFRIQNEVPTVLMIIIVLLVVLKPGL